MNKKLLVLTISVFAINNNFARIGSIGLQKVRSSVVDALKNSEKLDKNSFKKYIEQTKENKENDPKNQLADIIKVAHGSTVKGLPTYTSKVEKEANDQIEFSQNLIENFIKWANQFELVELMEKEQTRQNTINSFGEFFYKLSESYENPRTIFINFASDLIEEQKNIDEQILILDNLKDRVEVKSNNKISEKLNSTISKLNDLRDNLYKLIEKVNNLIGNSFNLLLATLYLSNQEQGNECSESSCEIETKGIEVRGEEETEEPEFVFNPSEIKPRNIPEMSENDLTFQPFNI